MDNAFGALSKNYLPNPEVTDISSCVFFWKFVVLSFTLRSTLSNFWVWCNIRGLFILLYVDIQLFEQNLLNILFFRELSWHLCQKLIDSKEVYFLIFLFHWFMWLSFYQFHPNTLLLVLILNSVNSSALFYFEIVLAVQGPGLLWKDFWNGKLIFFLNLL